MNTKKFSEAIGKIDSCYIDEAIRYKKKSRLLNWIKWTAPTAACFVFICAAIFHFFPDNDDEIISTTDAALMVYVNGILYEQSTKGISYKEWNDDFVYLGQIKSDITDYSDTTETGVILDGIPKENFQANHPIIGANVYQYGDNIVIQIDKQYRLYEAIHNEDTTNKQNGLSEREKMQLDPSYHSN